MQTALFLQPEAFAAVLLDCLVPLHGRMAFGEVFARARPVIHLPNESDVPLGRYSGPLYAVMRQGWQTIPDTAATASAP